ncbi:MAG: PEP-CTERM sorting domain-containing protein, partial [Verrucomicrobiaceae bacterium]
EAADATTSSQISFATTNGTTVPHIGGQAARYLSVPSLTGATNGINLTFSNSGPNGGGNYINDYTLIMDIYSPGAAGWQALFNTDVANTNDADFYINTTGQLGIGELGYGASPVVSQNQWTRIAFVADLDGGIVKYFVNGTLAHTRTGAPMTDGRFALYSNANAGADLLLFNEGISGVYTHDLYVNSVAFTDATLSDSAIAALGGPSAAGIFVPEPGSSLLAVLSCAGLLARRRRA